MSRIKLVREVSLRPGRKGVTYLNGKKQVKIYERKLVAGAVGNLLQMINRRTADINIRGTYVRLDKKYYEEVI